MEAKKIRLPFKARHPVLALGANTKNTVCLFKDNFAYLSPIHPDLNSPKDFLSFEKSVKYFLKQKPRIIAYDLHPEYESTKYAQNLQPTAYSLQPIQHHHAHIASCMAENGLKNQKLIGVAFDGTGLGSDNHIWGAEFLICDYKNFKRSAHLKEIPLVGGEKAILEPWRLVEAWFDFKVTDKGKLLKKIYNAGINAPLASSMGRLFDAAGVLILNKNKVKFDAELAIQLENLGIRHKVEGGGYKFGIIKNKDSYLIDPLPILREIIKDLRLREPKEKIAYRFHLSVAEMIKKVCIILRKKTKINKIVLSGGVFQNNLLLRLTLDLLYRQGFIVFRHKNLSSNDAGISLGEAVIANFRS